ncbi:DUF190 domain-containing protein [Alicyclobacillus contaminans]|uniref:DUF190 domain-containing protein n=1 Tax=Alicyclobacillus contaminans TaxID=392016 RepID=UPI0004063D08|nr:DUF190 domain-containing protein [Alicyclobacillus contaminans]
MEWSSCGVVKVGLWNGFDTNWRGQLVYRALLEEAYRLGTRSSCVWGHVEGSRSRRSFRTVESEVASNALPVMLEFIVEWDKLEHLVAACCHRASKRGIVVVEAAILASSPERGTDVKARMEVERLMTSGADGLQVQVFTMEQTQRDGKPLYQAVAEQLRAAGILWVSTARGMDGGGRDWRPAHRTWLKRRDVPVVITALDRAECFESCLPQLTHLAGDDALIVCKPVIWHHPPPP